MQKSNEIKKKYPSRNYDDVCFLLFPEDVSFNELAQLNQESTLYIIARGHNPQKYYAYDCIQRPSSFDDLHEIKSNQYLDKSYLLLNKHLLEIKNTNRLSIVSEDILTTKNTPLEELANKYHLKNHLYKKICLVNVPRD